MLSSTTEWTTTNTSSVGLSKKTEIFFFFEIIDGHAFQAQLKKLIPQITTADRATGEKDAIRAFKTAGSNGVTPGKSLLPVVGINIAFSQKGLISVRRARPTSEPSFNMACVARDYRRLERSAFLREPEGRRV
jgi:hypothetical protein